MKISFPFLLSFAVLIVPLKVIQANGGGYSFGVEFTGGAAPFQAEGTEHIQIVREDLHVDLGRKEAIVQVRYVMRNVSRKTVKVRFGFPIDVEVAGDPLEASLADPDETLEINARLSSIRAKVDENFHDYRVESEGRGVPSELFVEPFALGKVSAFPGSEALAGIGAWMVSSLKFEKAKEKIVTIGYRSGYAGSTSYVSDDLRNLPKTFGYRLSTGAIWHGPIQEGRVVINLKGAPSDTTRFLKPEKPAGDFSREKNRWIWEFRNFEPTLADDLLIEVEPGDSRHRDYTDENTPSVAFWERENRWYWEHRDYQVRASSTLAPSHGHRYDAANVKKLDYENEAAVVWVEGADGEGVGEYLEFTFPKPRPIAGLAICSGFYNLNDEVDLFAANHRPATLEVRVDDAEEVHRIQLDDTQDSQTRWFPDSFEMPDKVKKIRLTIRSVYRGTRYEDTCISRVHFLTPLAKKPVFRGAR